jgi:hypothetical protein
MKMVEGTKNLSMYAPCTIYEASLEHMLACSGCTKIKITLSLMETE